MKKRIASLVLALAVALSLTACGKQPTLPTSDAQQSAPADKPETVLYTDACGRDVEIPSEISRIVPSGALAQIILFAIAPEMFVGLADEWYDSAKGIIAEEYFSLPYYGQLYSSANLNVEELAKQNPDLIIDIGMPKDSLVEDLDTLQTQTNIPAVFIGSSLEAMPETYRTLGKLLHKEEQGEALAQFCERVYSRTISIMEQVGDNKVRALYITGEEGLNVIANGSYHAELIDMLTDNIAVVDNPASRGTGNEVSMEQLMAWDPDFIIFSPDSAYAKAAADPTWSQLSAISSGNYIETPEGPHNWMGTPPSVQRYLSLIWVPAVLYPEYCDYDAKAEILEFYKLFYGCELTDAQYETLTANAFLR